LRRAWTTRRDDARKEWTVGGWGASSVDDQDRCRHLLHRSADQVKFTAADAPLAQRVRISSVIFPAWHKVHLVLLLAMVVAMVGKRAKASWQLIGLATGGVALAIQWLWLMPF
jgi:hypothetical protein